MTSKARTLAGTVSTGAVLADGTVDASEIGNLTLPTGGDIVGTTATQTLTNKTIEAPNITNGLTLAGAAGTAGQVLTSAGTGAAPTWSSPAAGGTAEFVATGAISNGQTVALRSDGTVEVVSGSFVAQAGGSPNPVPTANSLYSSATYDSVNNVVLVAYNTSGASNVFIVAGTVSGTTITFGTPLLVDSAASVGNSIPIVYDPLNQVGLLAFRSNSTTSSNPRIISFTVSGTTITSRQSVVNTWGATGQLDLACSTLTPGLFLLVFCDNFSFFVRAQAISVTSLGAITLGTVLQVNSINSQNFGTVVAYSPAINRFIIGHGNSTYSFSVATVTGTTVTTTAATVLITSHNGVSAVVYCSGVDRFVISYRDASGFPVIRTADVTISSITYGTALIVSSNQNSDAPAHVGWSSVANSLAIAWSVGSNWFAAPGTISGTTITLGAATTLSTSPTYNNYVPAVAVLPTGRVAFFRQNDSTKVVNGIVFQLSYAITNAANYIGIAAQAISSGASGNVTIAGGVNSGVSGLTANTKYYVQVDGSLGTTNAGYPLVGRATAANKILVTNSLN